MRRVRTLQLILLAISLVGKNQLLCVSTTQFIANSLSRFPVPHGTLCVYSPCVLDFVPRSFCSEVSVTKNSRVPSRYTPSSVLYWPLLLYTNFYSWSWGHIYSISSEGNLCKAVCIPSLAFLLFRSSCFFFSSRCHATLLPCQGVPTGPAALCLSSCCTSCLTAVVPNLLRHLLRQSS